jgi:hypothetical protein
MIGPFEVVWRRDPKDHGNPSPAVDTTLRLPDRLGCCHNEFLPERRRDDKT